MKPRPARIEGVLFDLDGTLLDSAPDLYAALVRQCAEEGVAAPDYAVVREVVSRGSRAILRCAFADRGEPAIEALVPRYLALYEALLDDLNTDLESLKRCAAALSELDVLACFAERAQALDWVQPMLADEPGLRIEGGRHPVVEALRDEPFTRNDLVLDDALRMLVITGPNMGGKSTYMRQNALIVLLAHIGSFVPAALATIGPIDRILTRNRPVEVST